MSERVDSLYICPWSLKDPLCQSQSLPYIRGLASHGYKFALMTIENAAYAVPDDEGEIIRTELVSQGIHWYPISRRNGDSLVGKMAENLSGIIAGLNIYRRHRPRLVHSRSSLPLGIALALKKLLPVKFLYDADSVLSEEYVDIGYWSRDSASFKAMSFMERAARRQANRMIVLTETLKNDLQNIHKVKIPIDVIPCCVDTDFFEFDPDVRKKLRRELSLSEDETLITYVGKIGSWYLVEETFAFFDAFRRQNSKSHLLIVSPDGSEQFERIAQDREIPLELITVVRALPTEVRDWLSASDIGMCLIKQLPSKRGSSPVKFGEYLSVGLPVIVTDGIGDCSDLVRAEEVGLVINQDAKGNYSDMAEKLTEQILARQGELRSRCRRLAMKSFDVLGVGVARYLDIYAAVGADLEAGPLREYCEPRTAAVGESSENP